MYAASFIVSRAPVAPSRACERRKAAVFADPLYSVSGDRIMRRYGVGDPDEGSASSNRLDSGAHRLPLSAKEAEVLASLVPPEFILYATGPQASRDLMNNMDLSDYDLLHCALHGNCDRRKALLSGLMLSTYTQSGAWVDGWLGTGDIRTLKLNAELVTLSCCESGLELWQAEDGVGGLVKAFMIAGANLARRQDRGLLRWQVLDRDWSSTGGLHSRCADLFGPTGVVDKRAQDACCSVSGARRGRGDELSSR